MAYTPLDRQFRKVRDARGKDEDFSIFQRTFLGDVGWSELLKHQRVVVLAEAGSGKSRELEEQAHALVEQGEFAFHATVQNVAKHGLAGSVPAASARRLGEWLASDSIGWFFVDSFDEAKLDDIRFVDALARLADGIGDGRPRARIVLSGRYNSWEFRADLERLIAALPIAETRPPAPEDGAGQLIQMVRNERHGRSKDEPVEKPLVMLMAPLDKARVRTFAIGQGVTNVDDFLAALDAGNLWSFAQRPLDLGWLVDYWRRSRRFGRFAEMLETSLRERLAEPAVGRAKRDAIDVDRALLAMERIGATMVFGREDRIELPDSELVFTSSTSALRLGDILPDWPGDHQARLLTRPVFDPASFGHVRLHNDNVGVVRGFLAARWLHHRRRAGAPFQAISDLLFGDADGIPIVLPSCQETAAWLAIWDPDVAGEVVGRDPALLLTAGDPGSLSAATRAAALKSYAAQLASGDDRHSHLDRETLQRFSTPDLANSVNDAWRKHGDHPEVRRILLTVIELGRLVECASLAVAAVEGTYSDRTTLLYGTRALAATGPDVSAKSFVDRVKAAPRTFPDLVVWEVLELFFPHFISVDEFLAILTELEKNGPVRDLGWRGKSIVERLSSRSALQRLLEGLLIEIGPRDPEDGDDDHDDAKPSKRQRLSPLLQSAASQLINLTPAREANLAVVDAALLLSSARHGRHRFEDDEFLPMLTATPERRRRSTWHAVERLENHPWIKRWGLTSFSQLDLAGWHAGLKLEDVPWLLEDARDRPAPRDRRLALDGLFGIWRNAGSPPDLLRQIRDVAAVDQESANLVEAWLAPRKLSPEELAFNRKMARSKRAREAKQKKTDQSWVDFVDGLKADPQALRTPPVDLKPGNVDGRVFYLWRLLYNSAARNTEYAIDDFGELAGVLGPDLTRESRDAIVKFWRGHKPTLTSSRPHNQRHQVSMFDCMGITGVSLEAKDDPDWAKELTSAEAVTAAQLATLELNGFPHWTMALAATWPEEVRQVFLGEVDDHLSSSSSSHGFTEKLAGAEPDLAALVAPALIQRIEGDPDISPEALGTALDVITRAMNVTSLPSTFVAVALDRFGAASDHIVAALYLGLAFQAAPDLAIEALTKKLDTLDFPSQKRLAEHALPRVFGDRMFRSGIDPKILPFDVLERLVGVAFRTIRREDDNVHEGAFSPDERDDAERARSTLLDRLLATPGRPTIEALKRLRDDPAFPIPADRIAGMIYRRASEDAEHAPWRASEAHALEATFDTAPQTPRDLQLIALRRIADIDHALHHAEFAQGQTVKALPNEREVQKWVANELRQRQGRAYTLTREPHLVDEKEPDIRLQANAADASMPIEIKVAESWTCPQLEAALTVQLAGRYLRENDRRHGLLLLVHQAAKPRGWENPSGGFLSFHQVVQRLRAKADELAGGGPDAARPEIAVINVSDVAIVPVGARGGRKKSGT